MSNHDDYDNDQISWKLVLTCFLAVRGQYWLLLTLSRLPLVFQGGSKRGRELFLMPHFAKEKNEDAEIRPTGNWGSWGGGRWKAGEVGGENMEVKKNQRSRKRRSVLTKTACWKSFVTPLHSRFYSYMDEVSLSLGAPYNGNPLYLRCCTGAMLIQQFSLYFL